MLGLSRRAKHVQTLEEYLTKRSDPEKESNGETHGVTT
jgi:hypothetical protein